MNGPLRLPVCPHCGARFFYKQIRRTKGNRQGQCPHCGGKFVIVYKKQRVFLFLGAAAVAVPLNILLLWGIQVKSLLPLFLITLLLVTLAALLTPFVVRYRKRPPKEYRREKKRPAGIPAEADRRSNRGKRPPAAKGT